MLMTPRDTDNDEGWVLVPAIILMAVSLIVVFALLVVVDVQRKQGGVHRTADASQTLAEGVVSATAQALAQWNPTNAVSGEGTPWAMTACTTVSGNLGGVTTGATQLETLVRTAVNGRFDGTSGEFATGAATWKTAVGTAWKSKICPVTSATTERWNGADTTLAAAPTASPASLWVMGNGTLVRGQDLNSRRSVVAKVRQSSATFTPPANFAVGTGVFTTDLTTSVNTLLAGMTDSSTLIGSVTSLLGVKSTPLIADNQSLIGVRCGLLNTLSNTGTTCLTGTTGGLGSTLNSAGLGQLNTLLGTGRGQQLGTWTMAPDDAVAAWKAEAVAGGTYYGTTLTANGNDKRTGGGPAVGTVVPQCFTPSTTAYVGKVIYIQQVGSGGEGYCKIDGATTAKMIIVEKGAVEIQAPVNAVVYALNKQETESHANAPAREVIRIEGTGGSITGQAWADGAGGAVGIYPNYNNGTPLDSSKEALITAITDNSGICGTFNGGSVVNTLNSAVTTVTGLVGQVLGNVQLGSFTQTRYQPKPYQSGDSSNPPTGCDYLKRVLRTYTTAQLKTLATAGGSVAVPYREHSTRSCSGANVLGVVVATCGGWSAYSSDAGDATTVAIPAGLSSNAGIVSQLFTVLENETQSSSYSAITYSSAINLAATASLTTGAGPVVGSFRNVNPTTI